ncbi:MAG: Dna2/Cas4 domain-containing protein [Acidobacteria bacterium]|nr:Dna2/Cas4 domain-containing protein [Acidobacteriota bacterium]
MSRELILVRSSRELLDSAAEFLAAHRTAEVLVLAPARTAADEIVRNAPGAGSLGIHRLTLPQLAASLASAALGERKLAPMTQLGIEALASRVIHLVRRSGELHYFAPVAQMPGFPRALASTIAELRMEQVDLATLARSGAAGADLARLAARFSDQLHSGQLADHASTFEIACQQVLTGAAGPLPRLPLLIADLPLRHKLHERLVDALAAQAAAVRVLLLRADEESTDAYSRVVRAEPAVRPSTPVSSLDRLRTYLFSSGHPTESRLDTTIEIFSSPGEGLECVEIARRIHRLASEGTRFDRIAILVRNPERYQPLVEDALNRAGLEAWYSRGAVRPDPAGRAFLALLACAGEKCSASRFSEYLSLAQVPPLNEHGAPVRQEHAWAAASDDVLGGFLADIPDLPDPAAEPSFEAPSGWENLLVDAAVVGGPTRWARRLAGLESELSLQLDCAELDRVVSIEHRLKQLRRLQRFALPLIDLLAGLPRQARWGEWMERLTALAQTAIKSPESVLSILGELSPMADVGPVDLDEVYGVLSDRLRFFRRDPPPRRYGRVFVGTLDDARAREFDAVFVPGLAEGLFPRRAAEDPLLLDTYRHATDAALATQDTRFARERLLLHAAAAAAAKKLIVSYPRMDAGQSRPRVPSFYALEVMRAAVGSLPEIREFERRAAQSTPARLGWPAPEDSAEAVDAAEYDLAAIERHLRQPSGDATGAGRFLMDANPHLARALRSRWRRWNQKAWQSSDGMVASGDHEALARLHEHRLSERSYSPTALQQYAACPYKFYLYAVQQLRPREESVPLEQMDPLTRGALFHKVQFELFRRLQSENLLPMDPARLDQTMDLAGEVLDNVAAQYCDDLAPAISRVWDTEVEDLRSDLRGWIRHVSRPGGEWRPHRFELAFGIVHDVAERDPESTPSDVPILGSMRLRGSVDLVERSHRGVLRVVDHKTGRAPDPLPGYVGGGSFLQPLLYAEAVSQLLGEPVESGLLSYCTQRGGYVDVKIEVTPTARQRIEEAVGVIGAAIEEGFLPAAPGTRQCEYCDYSPVCGPYEEQRARRKHQEPVEPLRKLRLLP